jgi:hypothetical protein
MATLVSDQIRYVANAMDNCHSSAVNSGIVPDNAHKESGGYHCSIDDLYAYGNGDDYSNTRPTDRGHNPKYGAGIDTSMNDAGMILIHSRIMAVYNDKSDPRRKYFNAVNCWDGSGDAVRVDFIANKIGYASSDHKWHVHDETCRCYLLDWEMAYAKESVYSGQTKAQWLGSREMPEDEMALWISNADREGHKGSFWIGNKMGKQLVSAATLETMKYVDKSEDEGLNPAPHEFLINVDTNKEAIRGNCDGMGRELMYVDENDGVGSAIVSLDPIQEDRMVDKLAAKLGGLRFIGQPKV